MIGFGLAVAVGLIFIFCRLSWRNRLRMLSHPLALDAGTFVLLLFIHWGTFSGVMVATIGSIFCSMTITLGRKMFGYYRHGTFVPGWFNVEHKLR